MSERINLGLELVQYIEELYSISRVCERPTSDNEKCIQCREKEHVIDRLKEMVFRYYEGTPYHPQIMHQWPAPAERSNNATSVQRAVTGED